jgi:hypothetical protein
MTSQVTHVHADGTVWVRLRGVDYPITTRSEHLSLVAKRKPEGRGKLLTEESWRSS